MWGCARAREAPCVRSETRPSVDLRLLEPVALGEPLRVRQVDLRRVGGVLLDDLQRVVPHVVLEVEREQPRDVSQLQQQLARVRVRLR